MRPKTRSKTPEPGAIAAVAPQELPAAASELSFFELLHSFDADQWRGMKAYIYRLWPVIDRKEGEHFLAKVARPFDEDWILSTFGTGKYYVRLNDRRGKTIASHSFSAHNPDFPPKLNPEEVVASDPQNERYFKIWGAKETAAPVQNESGNDAVSIARLAMERSSRPVIDPQILDLWQKTQAQRDELAQRMADMSTKQNAGGSMDPMTMFDKMLDTMKKIREESGGPAKQDDPFSGFEKVMGVMEKFQSFAGTNSRPAPAESIWPAVASALSPALSQIGQLLVVRLMQPTAAAPPPGQAPPDASNPPSNVPPVAAAPVVQPPASTAPLGPININSPEGMDALQSVGQRAMRAFQRGVAGSTFASSLMVDERDEQILDLLIEIGKDGILHSLEHAGMLAMMGGPRSAIEAWLDDFMTIVDDSEQASNRTGEVAA